MTDSDVQIMAARAVLGTFRPEDIPDEATELMQNGYDTPSLRLLAGLTKPDLRDAEALVERAVHELGLALPSPRDAVMLLARRIAWRIATGDLAPYEGAKDIWTLSLRVHGEETHDLDPFVYAASEWEDRPSERPFFADAIVREARALIGTNNVVN